MKFTDPGFEVQLKRFMKNSCPFVKGWQRISSNGMCHMASGKCKYKVSVMSHCKHPLHPLNVPLEDFVLEAL